MFNQVKLQKFSYGKGCQEVVEKDQQYIIDKLKQASQDLLFPSESDYPFEVFLWEGQAPLTPEKLFKQTGHPQDTLVEVVNLKELFRAATHEQDWYAPEEKETVARFQKLVETTETTLHDIKGYRVGTVEIDVYIVGTANGRDLVGLSTKVVET